MAAAVPIEDLAVTACTIPTDEPESDGTLAWDSTTIVLVEAEAGGERGLGYTYGSEACAVFVAGKLSGVVEGRDPLDVEGAWLAMHRAMRNDGHAGIAMM